MQLQNEAETIYTQNTFKTMNRKVKQELLPPDTLYTCQNLRYDDVLGMLYKRPSRRKYNSTTLGTDPITSQVRYYKNSDNTKKYVTATSTFLKVGTDSLGTFANIKTGLTPNKKFTFITFKDFLYCFNGYDTNQVYNGTTCENMGVPIPITPTVAGAGSGILTGDYYYKVTYMIDSYQEGSSSTTSLVIATSSSKVLVTIPVSSNTRVTHRKIYRTKTGGSVYYLLTTIANNTDTTYEDNIADSSLATTQAPTDYGAPGIYRYSCLHKSRVFLARNNTNKSDIIFSDIRNNVAYPDVFPANNVLRISKDDGDEITGISEDNVGNLVVWKTNSVRIIHTDGDSVKGWSIGKPYTNFGNIAPYFIVKTPIGVIYMTKFGKDKNRLMLWSGAGVKHILEELDPILNDIDAATIENTTGHFHNGKIYISYTDISEFPDIALDSYTKLLMHCNVSPFTDEVGKTVTNNGGITLDTTNKALGAGSANLSGTLQYFSLADSDDWNMGSGGFTYEFRVLFTALPTAGNNMKIWYQYEAPTTNMFFLENDGGTYKWGWYDALKTNMPSHAATITTGVWYTVAITREGNNFRFFQDGVQLGDTEVYAGSMSDIAGLLNIGANDEGGTALNGKIDEIRISKGIARYTGNYTPNTTEFGYSYNNKLLIIDAETLSMINIDDKNIDSFSSWNSGTDLGELYTGTSDVSGFCYEEETDTSASETTIEINAKWGKLNFGQPRLKKRLRQVKIEFERTVASGTLSYYYSLDGGAETQVDIALATYASGGSYIYYFPTTAFCFHIQPRLYSNSDISSLGIKRLTYVVSTEPYMPSV